MLNLQTHFFGDNTNFVEDKWLQPFDIKNSVDTMYYTRHTQVDLRNPYHNDYLRYHPKQHPKYDETEYEHFIPQMTKDGQAWKDVYRLGPQMIPCTLNRTKFPYVF